MSDATRWPLWPAGLAVVLLLVTWSAPPAANRLTGLTRQQRPGALTRPNPRDRAGDRLRWASRWANRFAGLRGDDSVARARHSALRFVEALASELSVGRPPVIALNRAAAESEDAAVLRVARSAVLGADAGVALRELGTRPGWSSLAGVAACWSVGVDAGAGLASGLRRIAAVIRAEDETARELAAVLAAPRATGRMLAVLPLVGLGLGTLLGARPWQVLVSTWYGWVCLVVGGLLAGLGVRWVESMARAAQPQGVRR